MSGMDINLDFIHHRVTNLGPGLRMGMWVRGCSLGCPGCLAPELGPREPATPVGVDMVFQEIMAGAEDHVGLTISGGEPFEQAAPLKNLLHNLRRSSDLDFMVYTGYTLAEIKAHGGNRAALLDEVDILIDGRYREDLTGSALYRGSDNQGLYLLTPRAKARYPNLPGEKYELPRTLQYFQDASGRLRLIGIPDRGFSQKFDELMTARGLELEAARTRSSQGKE